MRRTAGQALLVLLAIVMVAGLAAYGYLRQSLPVTDGAIAVAGTTGPIEIIRDRDAVPHIFASTKLDALYGLGYVHAQDRLWQMEFQRRIGYGRLSEIFGAATLPQDRFLRTVGFARAAGAAWDRLPADARRQIDAYTSGINEFIATHSGSQLPPEFSLLRFQPRLWTGPDVLVWVKMMAWDLSANYSSELMRHDLVARVGMAKMSELLPRPDPNGLSILGAAWALPPDPAKAQTTDRVAADRSASGLWLAAVERSFTGGNSGVRDLLLGGTTTEGVGSNNWVVDGTMTESGKPLLANDPHLATHIPSLWYLAHISAGDFDVIGATLPGTPAVAIGRNQFIAWGETNVAADVEDLYRERLDPAGQSAEFRGAYEPLRLVKETITIKGAPAVHLDVRITRHGPLISDAINANNAGIPGPQPTPLEPLALRWTALDEDDRTIVAFLHLNEARDWAGFTAALKDASVPAQNFVFADVDGHIGYYAPGHIPIRASGDGSLAADGWTGEAEWTGWVPFDQLPHVYDPPQHFIVTANNRPAPSTYPYLIGDEYPEPYRAQRITALLEHRGRLRPDDFRAIQADTLSLDAQALVPLLLQHVHPHDTEDQQAVELLKKWDFDARGDSAAAAVFEAWFTRLAPALAGDELGPSALNSYEGRFSYVTRFITATLTAGQSEWCDDVTTPAHETCDDAVTSALHDGVARLTKQLGSDVSRWRWEAAHPAVFPHQGLDAVGLLRPLLSRSIPNGGDFSTVNVGTIDVDHPFEQRAVAGYRQIVDLSPANDSRFIDAVGQSGHFLSAHYDDFLADWHSVRSRRMRMDRLEIQDGAIGHLKLVPEEGRGLK